MKRRVAVNPAAVAAELLASVADGVSFVTLAALSAFALLGAASTGALVRVAGYFS